MSYHKHSIERLFFLPVYFFLIEPRWFVIRGGEWRKPPKNVSYKCTFGVPDQGQMLDVWGSQTAESALTWQTRYVAPRHILDLTLEVIVDQKIGIKDHDLVFSPGWRSKSLSLPRNQYRRERYVLGTVQRQDHNSLGVVQGQDHTLGAHLAVLHF